MKTLDEVIKALEYCTGLDFVRCQDCPGYCEPDCDVQNDALHYLKWFRARDNMSRRMDREDNEPLTWDELKQMEGKPVWVEILSNKIDLSSRWMMVARETKAHSLPLAYTDDIGHWIYGHEDKLGKSWQAYRRNRNEDVK